MRPRRWLRRMDRRARRSRRRWMGPRRLIGPWRRAGPRRRGGCCALLSVWAVIGVAGALLRLLVEGIFDSRRVEGEE